MKRGMNIRTVTLGILFAVFSWGTLGPPAFAADVKVTGLIFGQYGRSLSDYNVSGTKVEGRDEFGVSRIYLNAEAKFSPKIKGKIVLEGNTSGQTVTVGTSSGTVGNNVFLKNAFIEYVDLYPNINTTLGLIGTPWIGFEEKIWGHRFIQKIQADQEGVLASADKGIGILGKIPAGFGEYHLTLVNGEGTTSPEKAGTDGKYKDVMGRVSITPLPENELWEGLKAHAYVQRGFTQGGDNRARNRYIGALSLEEKNFHLMGSYSRATTGDGSKTTVAGATSLHGSLKLPDPDTTLVARYDWYDPDYDTTKDARNRAILGISKKIAEGVRISLNDQLVKQESETATRKDENQLLFQFEAKF